MTQFFPHASQNRKILYNSRFILLKFSYSELELIFLPFLLTIWVHMSFAALEKMNEQTMDCSTEEPRDMIGCLLVVV